MTSEQYRDIWHFEPKHRFSTQNNILTGGVSAFHTFHSLNGNSFSLLGITLWQWVNLLYRRRRGVEWRQYWFRLIFITLMACFNTVLAFFEQIIFGTTIEATAIKDPVFVLGHPRTGTTMLHNLLNLDPRLQAPTTLQAGFPSGFMTVRPFKQLLRGVVSETRPMDNVKLSLDTPQEDELGVNVLSSGMSMYMPIVMMTLEPEFRAYFDYQDCSEADRNSFINSFLYFLRKLSVRLEDSQRLVLKSPTHTGKVRLLLQLFPSAKFVYIHRDPYTVFQSAMNMADKTYWYNYLSTPTNHQIIDFIVNQYEVLFANYIRDRDSIPEGNLCEVSFAEMEQDPVLMLARVYQTLGWSHFEAEVRGPVETYMASLATYKKNSFTTLTPQQRLLVQQRWGPSFDEFGYAR